MTEIYTDGACLGNPGPGGWGAVVVSDGQQRELSGGEPKTTNNRMEITAVVKGLEQTRPGERVKVVSDSEYVIKTMTRGWQRKVNTDLWDALDTLVGQRKVSWEWVRGHNGHPFNELADRLANSAAKDVAYQRRSGPERAEAVERPSASRATVVPPASQGEGQSLPQAKAGGEGATRERPVAASGRRLSHVDATGKARMVDVGAKDVTERVAVAKGAIVMQPETLQKVRDNAFEKGDVLAVARVAGVMAAKKTHELIPLCHPIPLTQVTVDLDAHSAEDRVEVTATARATWKTGVEMEALTAVTAAALTVYDMCKSVDRRMRIESVRLVRKTGGKSGDYEAE